MIGRCPCGSARPLTVCCGRFHAGAEPPDAATLMRSRFSAYALRRWDYLWRTLHPDHVDRGEDFETWRARAEADAHELRFRKLLVLASSGPDAEGVAHVLFHAYDGYTTNIPLEEALKPDVLLAHTYEGHDLPIEHGGPVRVITPQLYAWKGAKWVRKIEVLAHDQPGFWETRGYSNTAHPWRNDRYG